MADSYDHSLATPFWQLSLWVWLVVGPSIAAAWATDRTLRFLARRRERGTEEASLRSWKAQHPWRAALLDVWSVPLGLLLLVLVYPAPLGLRAAVAALLIAITVLLAAGLCLTRNQEERMSYTRRLENRTTIAPFGP